MKEIIENVKLVENAPLEEPARQYYFMEKAKEYVAEMSEKLGRPLTACVTTFGWPMNLQVTLTLKPVRMFWDCFREPVESSIKR